ncbi:unnamed protein product [Clonostachys chloroleuca]|uniref:Uncharacterized protein n=1 Tax=Clonostachys chloroleuca TaxID=1926264 RepID=A0AA35Q2P5_9HYPO|nr:unnamed protein product [Clonostachys chloroleuca]
MEAAAGIGKETAFAFAEAGVQGVAFADINGQGAQQAAEESKKYAINAEYKTLVVNVDMANENVVQEMIDKTVKEFGRIDYAVNSAGMGNLSGAIVPNLKLDIFNKTIDTNVKGAVYFVRAITDIMATQDNITHTSSGRHGNVTRSLGRGSIVLLGSVSSYVAGPGMLNYTASKHAIMGITKATATDCSKIHIRVNAVCPSWVDTPMNHATLKRAPQMAQMIQALSPLKRVAAVDEVADYIIFLCSPSASYINGTGLTIDAGMTVGHHV